MYTDSPDSSDTQSIHLFLSIKLSEAGLPYANEHKRLIRKHLLDLANEFHTLTPKTATFTHNDGRSLNLLKADGTIPMTYQGITYYIPTVIWLPEKYPLEKPLVYVNPTQDMIIKRGHTFVDSSDGMVSSPYLLSWKFPSSNLIDLGRNLSRLFGDFPPLYSKPSTMNGTTNPNSDYNRTSSGVSANGNSRFHSLNSKSFGRNLVDTLVGFVQQPTADADGHDPSSVLKQDLVDRLAGITEKDVLALRKMGEEEMDGLVDKQSELKHRQVQIDHGLIELQDEIEKLGEHWQIISRHSHELEVWLRETEVEIVNSDHVIDHDDAFFEPSDESSRKMLESSALDLAIEDVMYALDRALQFGGMSFEEYMRHVRLLAREQFFQRATSVKDQDSQIQHKDTQMQADVAAVSARMQQYVE